MLSLGGCKTTEDEGEPKEYHIFSFLQRKFYKFLLLESVKLDYQKVKLKLVVKRILYSVATIRPSGRNLYALCVS